MKRFLVILLLLAPLLGLYAQTYRSNQLGQMLGTPGDPNIGYCLVVEGDSSKLLLDGQRVWSRQRVNVSDDSYFIVTTEDASSTITTRNFKDGRLQSETVESPQGKTTTIFVYSEGRLIYSTTRSIDGSETVQFYLRSSTDELVGISENGSIRFLSDSYTVQDGQVIENLAPGLVVSGEHTVMEDGRIQVEENGVKSVYSPEGLLLSRDDGKSHIVYIYEGELLSMVETTEGVTRTLERYVNGKASEVSVYEDSKIVSRTVYRDEGNITTLYRDGRAVATVYYKEDDRTVDRIEYN